MKKKPASSDVSSRLDEIVSKLSSFEAILVEVIIGLIIFISVLSPKVAQASTPGRASLAVSWDRPGYAKVTSTYTNGTDTGFKCSGLTSCTVGPFWGTPVINYVVKDASTNYPIKDGSIQTFANSVGQGFATISWNWTYELQVYPDSAGGCTNAGTECRRANYVNNNASIPQSYIDLLAGRNYRVIVCLTACTFYAPQLKSYTETTGTPATSLNVSNFSAACNAYGLVNADFTWNRATGRSYDLQYLDKSTDANWPIGVNVPFGANPNKLSVTNLFPNQAYHFRVNSRIYGNNMWDTSDTVNFTVPNCTVPNKLVTTPAVLTSPIAANTAGMLCPTGSSAATVNFKWQAPTISGGTYDNPIYLDYSNSGGSFALGTFTGIPVAPTSTTYGQTNFPSNTAYFWRINAKVANSNPAQWVTSAVGQFTTPACTTGGGGGSSTLFRPTNSLSSQWTKAVPSGFTHAQSVGEATFDEDGSYIEATNDGLWDTFGHNPSGIATGTAIASVSVFARAKYVTGSNNNIVAPALVSGGKQVWADRPLTSGYANYMGVWSTDPATNLPWTIAGVDNLQIGVRKSYGGAVVRVTQVWAQVNLANGGGGITTTKAVLVNPTLANPVGISCTGGSGVTVNFKWQPATITGGTYDYAYIDYSVYNDNFVLPYKNSVLGSSATIFGGSGFASGVNYFWRVNYHVANSNPVQWVTSATGSFKAECGTVGGPSPTLRPTGPGFATQWSTSIPATSAHFQNVDDATADEDASYISATADGLWDTYTHNPSGLATGTAITSVSVYARAKYVTGSNNNVVAPALVSGGKQVWADRTITSGYADYVGTWTVDPATNLPWTVAGVDAIQIGVRKSYAGANVWVTQVWAVVNYNGVLPVAAMSCSKADINKDGFVNSIDISFILQNYTPIKIYNSLYDMNGDGKVDSSDVNLAGGYFGKNCFARTGAVNTVCNTMAPGDIVDVTFNWTPANGDAGIKTQWVDFDKSDHGMGGGWPAGKQFSPGVRTSGIIHSFPQGTTYFWRVNTQIADGSWVSSKTPSTFTTADCTPVPSNLKATAVTTEKLSDGITPCASGPYSVSFKWDNPNKGVGWYIDVTSSVFGQQGTFSNKSIDGTTSLLTTGSDLNVPLQFKPGITYYWRIFNGVKTYDGNSVSIQPCAQSSTELDYYIRMKETSILPADPTAINNKIATHPSIQLDLMGNTYHGSPYKCADYATCWDFLMQESIKNGVSPAWSLAVLYTEGAAMGFVSNSGATPCSASDFVCYVHSFLDSVNGRYPTAQNSYFKVYNPGDEYRSYYDWVDVFCGANAPSLCEGDAGSLFQYRVKPNYQFIAPGKLIQL